MCRNIPVSELTVEDLGHKIILRHGSYGLVSGVLLSLCPHPNVLGYTRLGLDTRSHVMAFRNNVEVVVGW